MTRYLVTGGLGFIGSALVRALVRDGHDVRILDNASRGREARLGDAREDVELLEGDIRDPAFVNKAVDGVDAVAHLAFVNGTRFFYERPQLVLDVGVKGIVNVLDACLAHGTPELHVASSSEVYQTPPSVPTDEAVPLTIPDPLNPRYSYGSGKLISELMALHYGRDTFERVTVFRPHNVYGPDMGWEHVVPQMTVRLKRLMEEHDGDGPIPFPIQGSGEQTRAFVHIDDFTRGLMAVLQKGEDRNIYHIGTMEEVTIQHLARAIGAAAGVDVDVQPGPEAPGGTPRRCPDITKLRALGYEPEIDLATGLKDTVTWYLEHANEAPKEEST